MPTTASPTAHVLVADDQPHVREALRLLLKGEGYAIETAASPAAVLSAVQAIDFDAVLLDLNYARDTTTGREGLELVSQLQAVDATLPMVVMTAWGSVEKAVEAMRRGARDFIEKPWDNARLLATLRTQVELGRALRRTRRLESENRLLRRDGMPELIAESAAMRPVLQLMERVAASDANVLISGEHGTGKEVVAQWLHAASPRAARPLVAVNLGGLSEGVFESEMFGHVKGAFTDANADRIGRFELAEGGTLLLDEIGTLGVRQQAKLLRVLETGEVERVGASRPPQDRRPHPLGHQRRPAGGGGRGTLPGRSPLPAQHHRDPPAAAARAAGGHPRARRTFSCAATRAATARRWWASRPRPSRRWSPTPGPATCASWTTRSSAPCSWPRETACTPVDLGLRLAPGAMPRLEDLPLEEVERLLIRKALERHGGNVSHAAKALGLSRSALYRRLQHYGL